jgi:anion-transporting  ArsA/GET3 family ATPase
MGPLLDRRFTFVTGKGGVGKSTVTAALALHAARRGLRTLVCELNTLEQVAPALGYPASAGQISELEPNLYSVNIRPTMAMEEYGLMKLRFRALYTVVFENPLVQSLVRFVPGVNDLLMLGKAFNHERETKPSGEPVWDRIIIDAPATGHGLTLFRLPKIIADAVPAGNMHREATEMWSLLTDPTRTAIHLVSLPEELPTQETTELCRQLHALGLPLGLMVVNKMPSPILPTAQREMFAKWTPRPDHPDLSALWDAAHIRESRIALGSRYGQLLGGLGLPLVYLPQIDSNRLQRADIEHLSRLLDRRGAQ